MDEALPVYWGQKNEALLLMGPSRITGDRKAYRSKSLRMTERSKSGAIMRL